MKCEMERKLAERRRLGNLRSLKCVPALIDFASNDYLGLARSNQLKTAVWEELSHWEDRIYGSTGSRLLTGNTAYAEALEEEIAKFHGYEAGLLYNCGYMANLGLLSSVAGLEDVIFYDIDVHASSRDGIRLGYAPAYPFRHQDIEHLTRRLQNTGHCKGRKFVCIESVYSLDGSIAPLAEICRICEQYEANLIVDEAHALGVYGISGEGLVGEQKLQSRVFAQVTTFGKALGSQGAIVLGSRILKDYLINFSRSCLYTTALPGHNLAAIHCAYRLLPTLIREREHLHSLISRFMRSNPKGFATPIQPVSCENAEKAIFLSKYLHSHGLDVRPLLSPTVKKGKECLRVCLHATNSITELEILIKLIL
jgi:8-amino-7-oxononanoate synthase